MLSSMIQVLTQTMRPIPTQQFQETTALIAESLKSQIRSFQCMGTEQR